MGGSALRSGSWVLCQIDRFGAQLVAQLIDDQVSTELLQRVSVPTTLAAAELDAQGAATYRFYTEATSAPALQPATLPAATATLFTGGLGLVLEPMAVTVDRARRDGER